MTAMNRMLEMGLGSGHSHVFELDKEFGLMANKGYKWIWTQAFVGGQDCVEG